MPGPIDWVTTLIAATVWQWRERLRQGGNQGGNTLVKEQKATFDLADKVPAAAAPYDGIHI